MLRRLQDSILALPCQALQVRNSCRVHTMLLASLDSSCQADDSDLVAVPASGTILEDPKAIRPFHCLDGCMTLLGGCELELIQCNIHRAKGSMHLSQDKADGSVGLTHPQQGCWRIAIPQVNAHKLEGGLGRLHILHCSKHQGLRARKGGGGGGGGQKGEWTPAECVQAMYCVLQPCHSLCQWYEHLKIVGQA